MSMTGIIFDDLASTCSRLWSVSSQTHPSTDAQQQSSAGSRLLARASAQRRSCMHGCRALLHRTSRSVAGPGAQSWCMGLLAWAGYEMYFSAASPQAGPTQFVMAGFQ